MSWGWLKLLRLLRWLLLLLGGRVSCGLWKRGLLHGSGGGTLLLRGDRARLPIPGMRLRVLLPDEALVCHKAPVSSVA